MRSGERNRPSLSHSIAVGEPTLTQLAAPPSAQKRREKLRKGGALGEMLGYMVPGRKREAKPPKRQDPTSAAPTPERQAKDPLGFVATVHAGGQVSHQARVFVDVFDSRIRDDIREIFLILQRGYEIAQRARATSSRAYTGAPYTGQSPDMDGHVALTDQDRRDLELFAHSWQVMLEVSPELAEVLKTHILRISNERTGRLESVGELGTRVTGYARNSDNATASGVSIVLCAGIVYRGALQMGAMKLQYARMHRRAVFEKEASRYALGEKERRVRDHEHEARERVTIYARRIGQRS